MNEEEGLRRRNGKAKSERLRKRKNLDVKGNNVRKR